MRKLSLVLLLPLFLTLSAQDNPSKKWKLFNKNERLPKNDQIAYKRIDALVYFYPVKSDTLYKWQITKQREAYHKIKVIEKSKKNSEKLQRLLMKYKYTIKKKKCYDYHMILMYY